MSHITATLHAYDCMGQVHASLSLLDHDEEPSTDAHRSVLVTTFEGSGESNHTEWMRDLLVALLEAL